MPDWQNISIFGFVQFFMLIGLFGLVVPIFPGLVVMWLAALSYGLAKGFPPLGIVIFVLITLLMIGGSIVDNVLMGVGARQGGASWWAILIALVAGIVGTIVFPPFGGIIAAPLAVLVVEFLRLGEWNKAWQAFKGLLTGFGLSYFIRLAIGIIIMGLWWIWVWKG